MEKTLKFRFVGTIIMLVMIALFSVIVMLLWNALIPHLFGLPLLNYWQAVGVLLLARILFGGMGGVLSHRGIQRAETHFRGHANKLREKWMNMSEDERKEFIAKEREFHGHLHGHHPRMNRFFDGEDDKKESDKKEDGKNEEKKDKDNE